MSPGAAGKGAGVWSYRRVSAVILSEGEVFMEKEFVLSFSSFYKAAYARDVLEENGLHSTLRKLPPQVAHSCSTGLYLRIDSIERVRRVLDERQIAIKAAYQISRISGAKTYQRV